MDDGLSTVPTVLLTSSQMYSAPSILSYWYVFLVLLVILAVSVVFLCSCVVRKRRRQGQQSMAADIQLQQMPSPLHSMKADTRQTSSSALDLGGSGTPGSFSIGHTPIPSPQPSFSSSHRSGQSGSRYGSGFTGSHKKRKRNHSPGHTSSGSEDTIRGFPGHSSSSLTSSAATLEPQCSRLYRTESMSSGHTSRTALSRGGSQTSGHRRSTSIPNVKITALTSESSLHSAPSALSVMSGYSHKSASSSSKLRRDSTDSSGLVQIDVKVHLDQSKEMAPCQIAAALAESARQLAQSAANFEQEDDIQSVRSRSNLSSPRPSLSAVSASQVPYQNKSRRQLFPNRSAVGLREYSHQEKHMYPPVMDVPPSVMSQDGHLHAVSLDRPPHAVSLDRPPHAVSLDRPPHAVSLDRPPHAVSLDRPPHAVSLDRPPHAVSLDRPPHAVSLDRPPHAVSLDRPPHAVSLDRPPHAVSLDRPPHAVSLDRPPHAVSLDRPLHAVSLDRPPHAVSLDRPPHAVSLDRQHANSLDRPLHAVGLERQPQSVSLDRPSHAVGMYRPPVSLDKQPDRAVITDQLRQQPRSEYSKDDMQSTDLSFSSGRAQYPFNSNNYEHSIDVDDLENLATLPTRTPASNQVVQPTYNRPSQSNYQGSSGLKINSMAHAGNWPRAQNSTGLNGDMEGSEKTKANVQGISTSGSQNTAQFVPNSVISKQKGYVNQRAQPSQMQNYSQISSALQGAPGGYDIRTEPEGRTDYNTGTESEVSTLKASSRPGTTQSQDWTVEEDLRSSTATGEQQRGTHDMETSLVSPPDSQEGTSSVHSRSGSGLSLEPALGSAVSGYAATGSSSSTENISRNIDPTPDTARHLHLTSDTAGEFSDTCHASNTPSQLSSSKEERAYPSAGSSRQNTRVPTEKQRTAIPMSYNAHVDETYHFYVPGEELPTSLPPSRWPQDCMLPAGAATMPQVPAHSWNLHNPRQDYAVHGPGGSGFTILPSGSMTVDI